jgi:hypothetical protein
MDNAERTVLEYLSEFGDTRESDLIQFIMNELGYSKRGAIKLLHRLEEKKNKKEKIFRVVHTKLRPPAVYYSTTEYVPLEIQKELIRAQAEVKAAELAAYAGH